ncbi:MAG: hypothetical protein ACNA7I_06370 [Candidatus Methanoperedens sp.]|nr:hypothetical protein [Candidatus Methanoperedens sp.]
MKLYRSTEREKEISTDDKLKMIEHGLKYLIDLDLFDAFYDESWSKEMAKFQDKFFDKNSYYDLPLEETDYVKQHVVEWYGEDYGLAVINGEFWMISTGGIDEGGYKWWYKIKINAENLETAKKVILLDKCLPGKYCNLYFIKNRSEV